MRNTNQSQHEHEHDQMAQGILQMWQSMHGLETWIFISMDENGHPAVSSTIPDNEELHKILRQLGEIAACVESENITHLEPRQ